MIQGVRIRVGKAECVISMQVSEKRDSIVCGGRTPQDTGSRINYVCGVVHDDSGPRSRTVGIW
jgi:hypothetical protein